MSVYNQRRIFPRWPDNPVGRQGAVINVPQTAPLSTRTVRVPYPVLVPGIKSINRTDTVVGIRLYDGMPDSHQILVILNELAQQFARVPEVRESTIQIIDTRFNDDVVSHAKSIVSFVKDHVKYVRDPNGSEYVISPVRLLDQIRKNGIAYGDCDDHVLLALSMLGSIGIDAIPVGVKLYRQDIYDHVISSMNIRGRWYDVDLCVKGGEQPRYLDRLVP